MPPYTQVENPKHFSDLLSQSPVLVVNFTKEGSDASAAIEPVWFQLTDRLSSHRHIVCAKCNVEAQKQIAESYNINTDPTFIIWKNGQQISRVNGANGEQLQTAVKKLASEAESTPTTSGGASSSSGGKWLGAGLPRGYSDVTDQVDVRGLDLLNADSEFGGVRTLFETTAPSSLGKGKGAASGSDTKKDWVESDVDEQLMLYIPFTSTVKVHTIQLTSLPPKSDDEDDDEIPLRPKTIHLYTNKQHNLGFEEAEEIPATQTIELKASDWDEKTGTAKLELRFVKFQNISSLVMFVVDGDGSGERTRIDRVRIIGEAGEKRDMGKLEKIGDDS